MKVTVENKKNLEKNLKVFVDKTTINKELELRYEQIKKDVVLKGFRPGKVPTDIIKKQFGKAIYGEVIDKILKESSAKAIDEKKIKPALQPKIDLKSFGEGKDLEYTISVTEFPEVKLDSLEKIKFDDYEIKIDDNEANKRIKEIAKNQKNFIEVDPSKVANEGDLISFDYVAKVDGNSFEGNEGKNIQLEIGKDLFIKSFDKQLLKSKKGDEISVEVTLPENFPKKELIGKKGIFKCKINSVKKPKEVEVTDEFAKTFGAKDLNDLKKIISKQINEEFKNSLNIISKNQILKGLEQIKVEDLPQSLIDEEVKVLGQGQTEEELKKNKNNLEKNASKRIKLGLILNEIGEKNNIKVDPNEIQAEIQKQLSMMPGQEKIIMDYYKKNPSASASLRGTLYEEKIINFIKSKAKSNKRILDKNEAEKIIKVENEKNLEVQNKTSKALSPDETKTKSKKKENKAPAKKKAKKVSKK
ncbi:trigger factor [Candidatus Pelagibacter sp.]|nr:trigger factor [Candidatus Pelagibacter sp.]